VRRAGPAALSSPVSGEAAHGRGAFALDGAIAIQMRPISRARVQTAIDVLLNGGFPMAMPAAAGATDFERRFRRHARQLIMRRWPALLRPAAALPMAMCWPASAARDAVSTARNALGEGLGGASRTALALAAIRAALAGNVPPLEFIAYRLFEPGAAPLDAWLLGDEGTRVLAALAAPEAIALADDKHAFAGFCAGIGVPAIPTLARFGAEGAVEPFAGGEWPERDLVTKPRRAARTEGVEPWFWQEGAYRGLGPEGRAPHGSEFLERHLSAMAASHGEMLVQPMLRAHPSLSALCGTGVPAARVVTGLWPDGTVRVLEAMAQRPIDGAFVAQGSFFALVDPQTGRIRDDAPGQLRPVLMSATLDRPLAGRALPSWETAVGYLIRAHREFPARAVMLGWDVAFTPEGPVVIETNIGLSFFQFQMASLRPALRTPAGALLEAWL